MGDSLDEFFEEVRSSCTEHAKRKGYTTEGPDAGDVLGGIHRKLGIAGEHGVGEIITKLVEYLASPRRLLMVKAAGWCWVVWKQTKTDGD